MRDKDIFRHGRIKNLLPIPSQLFLRQYWRIYPTEIRKAKLEVLRNGINLGKREKEIPRWQLYSRGRKEQPRPKEGVLQLSVSSETDRVSDTFDCVENDLAFLHP